jgi:hypothetical protein
MKMQRMVIDVPWNTPVSTIAKWAADLECGLYRRPDGTFCIRRSNPASRPPPVDEHAAEFWRSPEA